MTRKEMTKSMRRIRKQIGVAAPLIGAMLYQRTRRMFAPRRRTQTLPIVLTAIGGVTVGVGVGAGVMYLLDPDRGARRREAIRDEVVNRGKQAGEAIDHAARDLTSGARDAVGRFEKKVGEVLPGPGAHN